MLVIQDIGILPHVSEHNVKFQWINVNYEPSEENVKYDKGQGFCIIIDARGWANRKEKTTVPNCIYDVRFTLILIDYIMLLFIYRQVLIL